MRWMGWNEHDLFTAREGTVAAIVRLMRREQEHLEFERVRMGS